MQNLKMNTFAQDILLSFCQFNGSVRGYIVSANGRHEVMKRLLEKLDFNYVAEVSIGEILVKEDEF